MTATLETKIDALAEAVEQVKTALLGSPAPGSPPGLIWRVSEGERDRADLRRQIAELTAAVRALEATPGKTAITWWDRVGLGLLGLVLSAFGAWVGATFKGH